MRCNFYEKPTLRCDTSAKRLLSFLFYDIIFSIGNLLLLLIFCVWGILRGRFENSTVCKGRKFLIKSRNFRCCRFSGFGHLDQKSRVYPCFYFYTYKFILTNKTDTGSIRFVLHLCKIYYTSSIAPPAFSLSSSIIALYFFLLRG